MKSFKNFAFFIIAACSLNSISYACTTNVYNNTNMGITAYASINGSSEFKFITQNFNELLPGQTASWSADDSNDCTGSESIVNAGLIAPSTYFNYIGNPILNDMQATIGNPTFIINWCKDTGQQNSDSQEVFNCCVSNNSPGAENTCTPNPNATFMAVGDDGAVISSADGQNWTTLPGPGPVNLVALASGPIGSGQVVTLSNQQIFTSSDFGNTWKTATINASLSGHNLTSVVWQQNTSGNGGTWIAMGNGVALTSSDGLSWNSLVLPAGQTVSNVTALAQANGKVVAVSANLSQSRGKNFPILTLTDSVGVWNVTHPTIQSNNFLTHLSLNGVSTDGTTWLAVGTRLYGKIGTLLQYNAANDVWQQDKLPLMTPALNAIAIDSNHNWIAVGNQTVLSGNTTHGSITPFSYQVPNMYGVAWNGTTWVVVGEDGVIWSDVPGHPWASPNSKIPQVTFRAIAYI